MAQLLLAEDAWIRINTRRIPTTAVEMALLSGGSKHVCGATFYAIGRRELNWSGLNGVDLRRFEGIQVICDEDNVVVTAYLDRDLSNLRSRRPRRRNEDREGARKPITEEGEGYVYSATGTVASVPYALPMKMDEHVVITLVCIGCRTEQIIRIPRERRITPGKYSWECFACQEKQYEVLGIGRQGITKWSRQVEAATDNQWWNRRRHDHDESHDHAGGPGDRNPKTVLNLTAVPLSGNPASTLVYLLIDEALEAKKVIVEEVSEGGSVPELRMTNFANRCVLIVDGTELVGAKQNRIVNASFLIPPESVTRIPVSCVEQGRWGYKGREFAPSRYFSPHRIGGTTPSSTRPRSGRTAGMRLSRGRSGRTWRTCLTRWRHPR